MSTVNNSESKKQATSKQSASHSKELIAVILIRSMINKRVEVCDTLKMLNIHRQNVCSVHQKTPSILGMLRKVKDCTTFGEIDQETYKLLCEKRGEQDPHHPGKLKPYFRLSPPKKGFERKGTKKAFTIGGSLGYRGPKINDLIRRMI